MKNLLGINEAAKILGVSVQTLRNWDANGYLKSVKTAGGHRRYKIDDVKNASNKSYEVVFSYEGLHLAHLEKIHLEQGEKDPRAKECGGFTKAQIGILLKNQDTAHDEATKALSLELFYEIAEAISAPYLFDTRATVACNDIAIYNRVRCNENGSIKNIVCESESLYCNTYVEECWNNDDFYYYNNIITQFDKQCIEDCINNAANIRKCSYKEINKCISDISEVIDNKTYTKEHKIVIYPPELINNTKTIKLNGNLRRVIGEKNETFISRLIPDNKILVMIKSDNKMAGYAFSPYMIMCKEAESSRVLMRMGKKLLREGGNYMGVITVE